MRPHLTILAALHVVQSLFSLFGALVVLGGAALAGGALAFTPDVPGWVAALAGTLGTLLGIFLLALAVPGLALGYGLATRRSWARPLGLVVGALSLLNFPFGTALGVYTFWVLLRPETAALLGARVDAAYR